ncbi:unnamed protein product [Toxocara canis]|uniref:AcetylCoA_hydro domain-containing protein n=1 Tax=Toxocara canis TaxID=6265 RepID=A0A183U7G3_TOXCA|nr:unnamed protein product [Toxocara canis]
MISIGYLTTNVGKIEVFGVSYATHSGHGDYTPMFLSEIAKLFRDFRQPLDVALTTISPPDEHGNCSLGIAADCSFDAIRAAKIIIGKGL